MSDTHRESPTVQVMHFTQGSVEVEINTAYGEQIIGCRVSPRQGFNDRFAEHEVTFTTRDEDALEAPHVCMIGNTFRVKVPLATGEQEEVRRLAGTPIGRGDRRPDPDLEPQIAAQDDTSPLAGEWTPARVLHLARAVEIEAVCAVLNALSRPSVQRREWFEAIEDRACRAKDGSGEPLDVLADGTLALVRELRRIDPSLKRHGAPNG